MDNCIFCKIIAGEIPSHKIYEDDNTLAFLDIAPVNAGHVLVVPKKHYENLEVIPEADLCQVIQTVKKVGRSLKDNLGVEAYNIIENNGPIAGQIVPHLHFHLVPRLADDGLKLWQPIKGSYTDEEAEELVRKLKVEK